MTAAAWDAAPTGLLVLDPDGVVLEANATFLAWTARSAADVVGRVRLPDLLSVGGRIYWETHLAPLLLVERRVDEVAVELKGGDGRLPVLLTAVVDDDGTVRAALSSARERARYERELRAARAAAERAAASLRALQATTSALSRALGVDGVVGALLTSAVGPLGGQAATAWVVGPAQELAARGSEGEPPADLPASRVHVLERTASAVDGRVLVPLHGSGALHGVLSVAPRTSPGADPLDLDVLTAVGQQAGLALERAQLYEQSASVARELQHSLLALDPPSDARYAVATFYRPGVEALEVGGDWYDVFRVDDDVLAVVVGDVVGRGLPAASAMGQLRSAVRAVAAPGTGPGALLSRLDHFVEQVEAAGMATLAYAEIDLATGELRYACAGHPPPLLVPAAGDAELLWDGRSTPLGAFAGGKRSDAVVRLQPGDRVLLCTDGLFERRDRSLDEGLDRLRAAGAAVRASGLQEGVRVLTDAMLADERGRDDVCVLVLSWTGGEFERRVSADLVQLSATRRDLAGWLAGHGLAAPVVDDLVLATSEAVANAAEHGSGLSPEGAVVVRATVERDAHGGRHVAVEVADDGQWREATPTTERGRGLRIIDALVDELLVETGDGTTVVLRRRLGQGRNR